MFGSNDNPHICYKDTIGNIKYASYSGSSWEIETVDNAAAENLYPSIALDSNDTPHITYHSSNGDLKYARQCPQMDIDCDEIINTEDNCPNDYNPLQEDSYPPGAMIAVMPVSVKEILMAIINRTGQMPVFKEILEETRITTPVQLLILAMVTLHAMEMLTGRCIYLQVGFWKKLILEPMSQLSYGSMVYLLIKTKR